MSAEVWLKPGHPASQGRLYDTSKEETPVKLGLILSAGNVSSIGLLDLFYKIFAENQICVLKTNPVNAYLEPVFLKVLKPLIHFGIVEIVSGDAEVGKFLCNHPLIEAIHITGSEKTHNAILKSHRAKKKTDSHHFGIRMCYPHNCCPPVNGAKKKWPIRPDKLVPCW